jgi:hypothetical protein
MEELTIILDLRHFLPAYVEPTTLMEAKTRLLAELEKSVFGGVLLWIMIGWRMVLNCFGEMGKEAHTEGVQK